MMIVGLIWIQMERKKIKCTCTILYVLSLGFETCIRINFFFFRPCLRDGIEKEFLVSAPLYEGNDPKRPDVMHNTYYLV